MTAKKAAAKSTTYDWYASTNFEAQYPTYVGQAVSVEALSKTTEFIEYCDEYLHDDLTYLWAVTADEDEKPHRFLRVKAVCSGYTVTEA